MSSPQQTTKFSSFTINCVKGIKINNCDGIISDNDNSQGYVMRTSIKNVYISAIVRVLKADSDKNIKKETIEKLINYMNKNFPNYKSNKYINTLSKNRKIIYKLINMKMYSLINLVFKIKKG